MVASLTVITDTETKFEFTSKEVAALKMPGISLGYLVTFIEKMEKLCEIEPIPTQYKDGFIDRTFQASYAAKLMLHKEDQSPEDYDKEVWSWIWHILKDEHKFNAYIINLLTGEINIDIDNTVSSETN